MANFNDYILARCPYFINYETTPTNYDYVTVDLWVYSGTASAAPSIPTLTLYNLPGSSTVLYTKAELDSTQIGVRLTNSPIGLAQVSTLWLLVEYGGEYVPVNRPHNYGSYHRVGDGMSRSEEAN